MNLSIGPHWEKFVEDAVRDGRYDSASDVVREGLKLMEKREAKLAALREAIQEGLDSGFVTEEHVEAALREAGFELKREGI